jgi:class 3 adenylate cyclase
LLNIYLFIYRSIADTFPDVTVMFVSIHNFTQITSTLNPFEKVSLLNKIFSKFDKLAELHKVEKIKTIGPTYHKQNKKNKNKNKNKRNFVEN